MYKFLMRVCPVIELVGTLCCPGNDLVIQLRRCFEMRFTIIVMLVFTACNEITFFQQYWQFRRGSEYKLQNRKGFTAKKRIRASATKAFHQLRIAECQLQC